MKTEAPVYTAAWYFSFKTHVRQFTVAQSTCFLNKHLSPESTMWDHIPEVRYLATEPTEA